MDFKQPLAGLMLGLVMMPAQAALNVFACEPEWAYLVRALVPDADIHTATTAEQDPHYIEARPSLISAMRRADLAVCTGAALEAGWLPALISRASNRNVQPGKPGLFFASEQVRLHQPHDHVDRSMGDVHPEGDPHIHLDPDRVANVITALADRLSGMYPEQQSDFKRRLLQWQVAWNIQQARWRQSAKRLDNLEVVVQHTSFGYLLRWLGIESVADLEPKPGLPPSAGHLNEIMQQMKDQPADLILVASYQDQRPAKWLASQTGIPAVVVPGTVLGDQKPGSLGELITVIVDQLERHRRTPDV